MCVVSPEQQQQQLARAGFALLESLGLPHHLVCVCVGGPSGSLPHLQSGIHHSEVAYVSRACLLCCYITTVAIWFGLFFEAEFHVTRLALNLLRS